MLRFTVREQFNNAVEKFRMPNRMLLTSSHFTSNMLPGSSSGTQKRLKRLQKLLTPNEFNFYTKNFAGLQLDSKTGLPISGRGIINKQRRKKKQRKLSKRRRVKKNRKR